MNTIINVYHKYKTPHIFFHVHISDNVDRCDIFDYTQRENNLSQISSDINDYGDFDIFYDINNVGLHRDHTDSYHTVSEINALQYCAATHTARHEYQHVYNDFQSALENNLCTFHLISN